MLYLQQTGRVCYNWDKWHFFESPVKWQTLKCIVISLSSAKCYVLLHWDCLCHFYVPPLSHETTSYLFHSKSVSIIVSTSQHVSFKRHNVPESACYLNPMGERCLFRPHNQSQIINSRRQENEGERVEISQHNIKCRWYITRKLCNKGTTKNEGAKVQLMCATIKLLFVCLCVCPCAAIDCVGPTTDIVAWILVGHTRSLK